MKMNFFTKVEKISDDVEDKMKKEEEELFEEAFELLEKFKDIDDSKFPSFVFSVLINNYGEGVNYKALSGIDEDDPDTIQMIKNAMNLKRKYGDYHAYQEALSTYYDYVDYMNGKHGIFSKLYNKTTTGVRVRKPLLKDNKENKKYAAHNIILSKIDKKRIMIQPHEVVELYPEPLEGYGEFTTGPTSPELFEIFEKSDKHAIAEKEASNRLANLLRVNSNTNNDAVLDFIMQAESGITTLDDNMSNLSLTEIARNVDEYFGLTEDEVNDLTDVTVHKIEAGARFIQDIKKHGQMVVMKDLYQNGWDVAKIGLKNEDKTSKKYQLQKKALRDMIGGGPLDEDDVKEMKREERRARRQREENQARINRVDDALASSFRNNSMFEEEEDMFLGLFNDLGVQ